jgi:pyruvate dehydrogenase complex dehydrogenase (E1) component
MREMLEQQRDVFYYVTLMNESYAQPDLPAGAAAGVIAGAYLFERLGPASGPGVTLMGSGAILGEVRQAARRLATQGLGVDVISDAGHRRLRPQRHTRGPAAVLRGGRCQHPGAGSHAQPYLRNRRLYGPLTLMTDSRAALRSCLMSACFSVFTDSSTLASRAANSASRSSASGAWVRRRRAR